MATPCLQPFASSYSCSSSTTDSSSYSSSSSSSSAAESPAPSTPTPTQSTPATEASPAATMLKTCLSKLVGLSTLTFASRKRSRKQSCQTQHCHHALSMDSGPTAYSQQRPCKRSRTASVASPCLTRSAAATSQNAGSSLATRRTRSRNGKKNRSVQFSEKPNSVHLFEKIISYDDRHTIWYQTPDYMGFRKEAEMLADAFKKKRTSDLQTSQYQHSVQDFGFLRGLELWVCEQRVLNRYLSVSCIVSSSKKRGFKPEHVAHIARNCSAWPREAAIVQGTRDFFEVYEPQWVPSLPKLDEPVQFPYLLYPKKVKQQTEEETAATVKMLPKTILQRDTSQPIARRTSRR